MSKRVRGLPLAGLAAALAAAAPTPARAIELRGLVGADGLVTSGPSVSGVDAAELGLRLRGDLRDVGRRFDFRLDFMGREVLVGAASRNDLYELSATARRLGGRADVSLGRLRAPGGFWLIVDGARLSMRYAPWLEHHVYGGVRAFTTGRRNTWMSERPIALPVVGTSLNVRHRLIEASLSYAWARDAVDLPLGGVPTSGQRLLARHVEDEHFFDGYVALYPHEKVFLSAGAQLGTRYDVRHDAQSPYGDVTLGTSTLGSVGAFGVAEVRPIKRLRLGYTFHFERVRLFESELLITKPDSSPVRAADGSFQDHRLRISWLAWRALRVEAAYRLRYRANTDLEHRVFVEARGDDLWRGLGGFVSVGVDVNSGYGAGTSGERRVHDRVLYSGGLSYVRAALDLRLGVLYTDAIGSGLVFSQPAAGRNALFPTALETQRIVFLRGFALLFRGLFVGADLEANLDLGQLRALAQVGVAL